MIRIGIQRIQYAHLLLVVSYVFFFISSPVSSCKKKKGIGVYEASANFKTCALQAEASPKMWLHSTLENHSYLYIPSHCQKGAEFRLETAGTSASELLVKESGVTGRSELSLLDQGLSGEGVLVAGSWWSPLSWSTSLIGALSGVTGLNKASVSEGVLSTCGCMDTPTT